MSNGSSDPLLPKGLIWPMACCVEELFLQEGVVSFLFHHNLDPLEGKKCSGLQQYLKLLVKPSRLDSPKDRMVDQCVEWPISILPHWYPKEPELPVLECSPGIEVCPSSAFIMVSSNIWASKMERGCVFQSPSQPILNWWCPSKSYWALHLPIFVLHSHYGNK